MISLRSCQTGTPRSRRTFGRVPILLSISFLVLIGAASPGRTDPHTPNAADVTDEVLTLEEAADLLELDPQTISTLAENGTIPGRRLGPHWRFSRTRLLEWLAASETKPTSNAPEPLPESDLERMRATGPETSPEAETQTVGEAPIDKSASDIFLRSRRVLLRPGQLVIEPLLFFTRADTPDVQFQSFSSSDGVPISAAVGQAANIEQNITTASLTGRIGLGGGFEGNTGLIFQDRRIKTDTDPEEVDTELRSIFLGFRRTLVHEERYRPELVVGVQGIGPLGDTSPAVGFNIFAVKSADPLAMFAGFEYQHTFSHNFDEPRKLEPKDTFGAQIGYVFAVTDQTSLNSSIQGLFVLDSSFRAGEVHANEQFSLRLGVTQRLTAALYVEPSVAFGLNGPGDFVTFGLRFPWIASPSTRNPSQRGDVPTRVD